MPACHFCTAKATGHRNYLDIKVHACPKHLVARIKDLPVPREVRAPDMGLMEINAGETVKSTLPPRPTTPRQSVRVKDDLWHRFIVKARENGTTGSEVLRERIEEYVSE
jgi:hypothetical protein